MSVKVKKKKKIWVNFSQWPLNERKNNENVKRNPDTFLF